MAKIALISRSLNLQVLTLAQSLALQRNQVQIITSKGQSTDIVCDFSILNFFNKWSLWETLQLIRVLVISPPDIFHFVFEENQPAPTMAHHLLLRFAQQIRRAQVVTIGEGQINPKQWRRGQFIASCNAVVVPSREKLMFLRRRNLLENSTLAEVVLPMTPLPDLPLGAESIRKTKLETPDELQMIQRWGDYLLVPTHADKKNVDLLHSIFGNRFRLVFLSQRSSRLATDLRCICLPEPTPASLECILRLARGICLATHNYSIAELALWQSHADRLNLPLLAHRRQTEALPGLCLHERNGFVIDQIEEDLRRILETSPRLEISNYKKRNCDQISNDHSLNQVNRIYSLALGCQTL